ncbi:uncharacterized protein LOC9638456 [Selaginella moellendorffii]|nr:uncharacterized protein LOC9638456 [Selaginella moellendorffii]|eukprot:XP_002993716.2 uncharacterized protein LOC9638456 [Selaginella moellendorffii]
MRDAMLARSIGALLSIADDVLSSLVDYRSSNRLGLELEQGGGGAIHNLARAGVMQEGSPSPAVETGKLFKEVSRAFSGSNQKDEFLVASTTSTTSSSSSPHALLASSAQQLKHRFKTSHKRSRLEELLIESTHSEKLGSSHTALPGSGTGTGLDKLVVTLALLLSSAILLVWYLTPAAVLVWAVPAAMVSLAIWTRFVRCDPPSSREICVQGQCSGCRVVSQDKQEEEEQQLAQRAHRAKQQFMAYVFHNIRVPFNAIVLGLGHMRASASGDDSSSGELDLVQLMLDCAETMTNVLDDVTDMGNWEEGRIELHRDVFDLLAVVKFLAWGLKDLLEQKQISLNIDIDPVASKILKSHNIVGDKHRTVQTLGNFLSNAVKFTPTGGKLDLEIKCQELDGVPVSNSKGFETDELEHKSLELFIAVNDSGAGISLDDQDRLFEADSFISSPWVQKAGVSGLGLSVAKRFIEQIGGQIGVRSRDQGSTFFFSAPFLLVPIQKRTNSSVPASGIFYNMRSTDSVSKEKRKLERLSDLDAQLKCSPGAVLPQDASPCRRKVLLVEDTRINRIILRKVLQNLNLQCDEAENGQIAVDLHRQGKSYDLVLMDKEMPVMDGHEATRALRMMGVKTPIVALTGNALQSDKELFFEAGVNEFQTKPLSRDKLIQLLARYGVESSSPPVALQLCRE